MTRNASGKLSTLENTPVPCPGKPLSNAFRKKSPKSEISPSCSYLTIDIAIRLISTDSVPCRLPESIEKQITFCPPKSKGPAFSFFASLEDPADFCRPLEHTPGKI
jgi:hypothetical protein